MKSLTKNESGLALVTVMLVLMLVSGLMAGMFAALLANDRSHATDRDQSVAYAAAHAGLEKLTAGLAALFGTDFSPSAAQLNIVDNFPPLITGFEYRAPGGLADSGYVISFTPDANGNPAAFPSADITTGPFEGFKGLITPYTLTVTARSTTGNSEVRLRRELQTVAVPVFQFGIFGEKSLGFHAGPTFDFGGRVHTNESLYLAAGDSGQLIMRDKITAFISVVRNRLSNGVLTSNTNHEGPVTLPTVIGGLFPSTYRNLQASESSGTTAAPIGTWKNLSEVTYKTNIRTEATGAKKLNLPLTSQGAAPIDLIKRAPANENIDFPQIFGQRYFAQASLRILLSDRAADITSLPTIDTAVAPINLEDLAASGYVVGANRPPVALSPGSEATHVVGGNAISDTRVDVNPVGTTLQFRVWNGAAWPGAVSPVPTWLKWTTTTTPLGAVVCTGLTSAQLSGCGAHVAFPAGTVITFTNLDGTTFTATTGPGNTTLNNATINLNGFSIARRMVATRVFYVAEQPVTCTGFTANTLTGCRVPSGVALNSVITSQDPVYTGATTPAGTSLVSGFLKIERQDALGVWTDVTLELLNFGFADRAWGSADPCADPTPNAVIRFQRLRDNALAAAGCAVNANSYNSFAGVGGFPGWTPTDFVPLNLFDAREGSTRHQDPANGMHMGGLIGYVAFDAANFALWAAGTGAYAAGTGNQAWNNNGYIIYFSDRRGDHDETNILVPNAETGEYGNEDFVNPNTAAGAPNAVLDPGENVNESNNGATPPVGTMQIYGATPSVVPGFVLAAATVNFGLDQRPWTQVERNYSGRGRLARPVLFRRALKIVNASMSGTTNPLPASGISITAENPIYVQGNFNALSTNVLAEPNVPAAIMGDSVTLLSNAFNDAMTFLAPYDSDPRVASDTGYRFAMLTGKQIPFPRPAGAWAVQEMGSDGGVHNFMKMLENWGGRTVRYRGSMVSLYYSRQAIGIYRAGEDDESNIYSPPTRNFNFDSDFLIPALLPPGTPMFRDINTLKFRQILRPNQ